MALSSKAKHYLESLWGERLRELITARDARISALRHGLVNVADVYERVGFLNFLEPSLAYIESVGSVRAECALKAYALDNQKLSNSNIEEILVDAGFNMEAAGTSLITEKRNEIQAAQSYRPSLVLPEVSEISSRAAAIQHETRQTLERQLTIRMYEAERENENRSVQVGGLQNMPRIALVLNVLVASPSDVSEERDVVSAAIHDWNAANSPTTGIMLQPIRWETHSFPASGDRPQAIINQQIVDTGDFLIGIFGTRLGTPTGEAQSGTIEEIERFRKAGKLVSLYFSKADLPRSADRDQLKALEDYQSERQKDTLYATFNSATELRQHVSHHLPMIVARVYKTLRSAHALDDLKLDVRQTGNRSEERLSELAQQATEPLKVNKDFVGEYPDGPRLWVTANRPVTLTQIDYLDERNVKIGSQQIDAGGQDFEVSLDYQMFPKIYNMKRRSNFETAPMGLRLYILDGQTAITEIVPTALQPGFKHINNASTMFFKLLG